MTSVAATVAGIAIGNCSYHLYRSETTPAPTVIPAVFGHTKEGKYIIGAPGIKFHLESDGRVTWSMREEKKGPEDKKDPNNIVLSK